MIAGFQQSQQRGATQEAINAQKEQIFSVANSGAKERVKVTFMLARIAEKEGIQVTQQEVAQRVTLLADQYQMTVDKLVKQLQERNGFAEIQEQIMSAKTLDFLVKNAAIEEVPAAPKA